MIPLSNAISSQLKLLIMRNGSPPVDSSSQPVTPTDNAEAHIVFYRSPFWRLLKYTERGRKMAEANQVMDSFAYGVIDDRRREMAAQGEKKENAQDLLGYYLAVRDENGQPMSRKALRDAVLNLIIAGVSLAPLFAIDFEF